jgi:hypothetical protein
MDDHAHRARSGVSRRRAVPRLGAAAFVVAALVVTVGVAPREAAAAPQTIFQDGFESGNITAGGWTSTGALTVDSPAYAGAYAARIDDSGSLQKTVSTVGFTGISLSYARYTYAYESYEEVTVEWSTNGTTWTEIEQYNTSGWGVKQVALPSSADGQSALRIRFRSDANGAYERFRVDEFVVSGESGGTTTTTTAPTTTTTSPPSSSCLPPVTSYTTQGSFTFTTDTSGATKMWIPQNLPSGCRVPIIHFANGTGASCSTYTSTLQHFASHGFVGACYESTQTGQGTQAITAIEAVTARYPNIVSTSYGFTGHSQGGGGAILGVYRAEQKWGTARTYTGFGVEPAHGYGDSPSNWTTLYGQINSSISMFNGSDDGLVSASWVGDGYNALKPSLEKAWYEAVGASHTSPVPNSYASEMGLAWFRWQLLDDSAACQYFKNMPSSSRWNLQQAHNLSAC